MTIAAALLLAAAAAPRPPGPEIAITFDDLPVHQPLPAGETPLAVADRILAALKAARLPAVHGFVNGAATAGDPATEKVLAAWRAAGYPLGNHGWSHARLDSLDDAAVATEIERNEPLLERWGMKPGRRWFRFPYLAEGGTPAHRAAIRRLLAARGYRIAAVTMSFGDYRWNAPYARCLARGDKAAIDTLEHSFLAAADAAIIRSRSMAKSLYGRDIPYVLLMHAGAFDAHMLSRLLALYAARNVRFVPLDRAERDPAYASDVDPRLPARAASLESRMTGQGLAPPVHDDPGEGIEKLCL